MGSKQGGETRKNNDILRFFEDSSFNLGIENVSEDNDNVEGLEVRHTYIKPKMKSAFHKRLNALLKEHKINKTQLGRDMAVATGRDKPIARQTIDNYASGKTSPTLDIVLYLCQRFGCSCNYLIGMEDSVTIQDRYITEQLGLTQDSIDYLRARKRKAKSIDTDYILNMINLLLTDSVNYQQWLIDKKQKKTAATQNGYNFLFHLSKYLNVTQPNTLITFSMENWSRLTDAMKLTFGELELDKSDQKIEYYREKVEELKNVYLDNQAEYKSETITETAMTSIYFQRLENSIKAIRKQLQQKSSI